MAISEKHLSNVQTSHWCVMFGVSPSLSFPVLRPTHLHNPISSIGDYPGNAASRDGMHSIRHRGWWMTWTKLKFRIGEMAKWWVSYCEVVYVRDIEIYRHIYNISKNQIYINKYIRMYIYIYKYVYIYLYIHNIYIYMYVYILTVNSWMASTCWIVILVKPWSFEFCELWH